MHTIFLPENQYSFEDAQLNVSRVEAFCRQLEDCKSFDDYFLLGEKAHWMLCAFWHGARGQFEYAQDLIRSALDQAEARL